MARSSKLIGLSRSGIEIDDKYYEDYKLYVKNDYYYLLSNNEMGNLIFKYVLQKKRSIKNGDEIGVLNIYMADKKIHEEKIFIEKNENIKKSFFAKIKEWFVKLW